MVFNFRTFSFSSPSPSVGRSVDNTRNKIRRFSFKELQAATRNFDHKNRLGEGAFGQVYRGRLANGSLVAVKRLRELSEDSERQFQTEVEVAGIVRHPNLLSLIGYCDVEKERLLVYPFMDNRSLDFALKQKAARPLDWPIRMQIALGVARGMAHMHDQCHPSIIHRDVSCSNILLNADFDPVLGDFGLARIMHEGDIVVGSIGFGSVSAAEVGNYTPLSPVSPRWYQDTYVNTVVRAHLGYGAPEYMMTGKCTLKVDVYLYGNMLLELISGRPFFEVVLGRRRNNWISRCMNENALERVVDPTLQGNYLAEEAEALVRLALLCADDDPSIRPKMSEVVVILENHLPGPDLSSRCSSAAASRLPPPARRPPPAPHRPSATLAAARRRPPPARRRLPPAAAATARSSSPGGRHRLLVPASRRRPPVPARPSPPAAARSSSPGGRHRLLVLASRRRPPAAAARPRPVGATACSSSPATAARPSPPAAAARPRPVGATACPSPPAAAARPSPPAATPRSSPPVATACPSPPAAAARPSPSITGLVDFFFF